MNDFAYEPRQTEGTTIRMKTDLGTVCAKMYPESIEPAIEITLDREDGMPKVLLSCLEVDSDFDGKKRIRSVVYGDESDDDYTDLIEHSLLPSAQRTEVYEKTEEQTPVCPPAPAQMKIDIGDAHLLIKRNEPDKRLGVRIYLCEEGKEDKLIAVTERVEEALITFNYDTFGAIISENIYSSFLEDKVFSFEHKGIQVSGTKSDLVDMVIRLGEEDRAMSGITDKIKNAFCLYG